jgi:hypothetical protein
MIIEVIPNKIIYQYKNMYNTHDQFESFFFVGKLNCNKVYFSVLLKLELQKRRVSIVIINIALKIKDSLCNTTLLKHLSWKFLMLNNSSTLLN